MARWPSCIQACASAAWSRSAWTSWRCCSRQGRAVAKSPWRAASEPRLPTAMDWPLEDCKAMATRRASWWCRAAAKASPRAPWHNPRFVDATKRPPSSAQRRWSACAASAFSSAARCAGDTAAAPNCDDGDGGHAETMRSTPVQLWASASAPASPSFTATAANARYEARATSNWQTLSCKTPRAKCAWASISKRPARCDEKASMW
mmetsp:Transcript_6076/g.19446  ORF Transcript_6076/g.19446 Transcript_6076/m.19446 type:complete len:205 (+) Transcript_6076:228-842(+)